MEVHVLTTSATTPASVLMVSKANIAKLISMNVYRIHVIMVQRAINTLIRTPALVHLVSLALDVKQTMRIAQRAVV